MKIVHLLPWPSMGIIGGTELFVKNISLAQAKLSNKILIVSPNIYDEEFIGPDNTIQYYKFPNPNGIKSRKISSGKQRPAYLDVWVRWLQKQKPDVLHVHVFEPYLYWFIKKAKDLGVKVFITPHIAQFTCSTGDLLLNQIAHCDGFIDPRRCTNCVISKKYKEQKKNHFPFAIYKNLYLFYQTVKCLIKEQTISKYNSVKSKLSMLNNICMVTDKFILLTQNYRQKLILNHFPENQIEVVKYKTVENPVKSFTGHLSVFRIIFVGRLSREKGIDVLLNSLPQVYSVKAPVEIHLYGRTHEDFPELDEVLGALQNSAIRIFKHGVVEPEIIFQDSENIGLLCIPSTVYEMSPLVIQESFSAGIPVVGSSIGGIAEYVVDGYNGLLFEPNDSSALSNSLNKLINDEEFYTMLRNNIKKPLGYEQISEDFIKIYSGNG